MKLEYIKERIYNYFDNVSPEELYNTLIKYKMKVPEKPISPSSEEWEKMISNEPLDESTYWTP